MKQQLTALFTQAIDQLKTDGVIDSSQDIDLLFERTRQKEHGDFATNIAMKLAKAAKSNPRELAQLIINALPQDSLITEVNIAGPGFINMFIAQDAQFAVLKSIIDQGSGFGLALVNSKLKILLEYVSANPTGPLHVGHGRGAAYGDALARVLTAAGHNVHREYYVNDAGRQMDILATSVWVRYLQLIEEPIELPSNCYQGDYIIDMSRSLLERHGDKFRVSADTISTKRASLDDETALDATIALAKSDLGNDGYDVFFKIALDTILDDIRQDLAGFGVEFDNWYSERSLFTSNKVDDAINHLKQTQYMYEKDGTWWFKSTDLGDEKDRVVVRENGMPTYFASDIAYHYDKIQRGFDQCINIWGADHHGYIPRVNAAMQAMGLDKNKLTVLLVQFAVLYQGGEKVSMSTRSGEFVTLKELREEVGKDSARFFYVQRKSEQHMDFDLDLAKSKNNENPVYYIQYAHARICSVFRQAGERDISLTISQDIDFKQLNSNQESEIITLLQRYEEVIENAAKHYEPHLLTYYLRDLANAFHSYYNSEKFLDAPQEKRNAMLTLCHCIKTVLSNGLSLIDVSSPESM